jgi:hypothetical protein
MLECRYRIAAVEHAIDHRLRRAEIIRRVGQRPQPVGAERAGGSALPGQGIAATTATAPAADRHPLCDSG